ncbi:MAG: hypothetical protein K0Q87_122 [Neobacillus sp.]|jgi:hypothetical protein|nr:hypothetical protein [Neobacillus sp.]
MSEKDLLEMLSEFPKHELSTVKRTEMLKKIGEQRYKKKAFTFNIQRVAALAALFLLAIIAPILYFSNEEDGKNIGTGTVTEVEPAEQGVYFALENEGKPVYVDSNFGIPNKVSLLAPKEWVAYDHRGPSKIMVFLWGKEIDLNQPLQIEATHIYTGEKRRLNGQLSGGMYGADAHAIVDFSFLFDMKGDWNLGFEGTNTNGKEEKIGEFAIYVKDQYISLGRSSTLLISKEDLFAGFYKDASIEVSGENLPEEIELKITNKDESSDVTSFIFKNKTDYTTTDGKPISMYTGDFQINKSGNYQFELLGFSEQVTVHKPIDH